MGKRFRILCLDGGGIKGTFTAAVLAELERATGRRVVDHVDLIAGTSTGGILALGLALGLPAAAILQFYRDRGPLIFPATGLVGRAVGFFGRLFRPTRDQAVLRKHLGDVFGDKTLGDAARPLVIPAFDATVGRIYLFKTAHHPRFQFDVGKAAADVATATAAAPTYYAAFRMPGEGAAFVDGGVWANCPTLVAVTEAIAFLDQNPRDLDVLSIGTTSYPYRIDEATLRGGLAGWGTAIVETMFRGQEEAARAQAALLTGGNVHRVNYDAPAGDFVLDNHKGISDLAGIGTGIARKKEHLDVVQARFLNGDPADPFRPYPPGAAPPASAGT